MRITLLNTPPTRPAPVLKLTLPRLGIVAPAALELVNNVPHSDAVVKNFLNIFDFFININPNTLIIF
ncbi:MAG: hypothetical protein LN560_06265 [Rickettsia endosymbiont of Sceptobius lativentris]|nr:hypothetical protein [Rickettsia endosymbiont of Sceptobius lativentris]